MHRRQPWQRPRRRQLRRRPIIQPRCTSTASGATPQDGKTLAVINPADESDRGRGRLRRPGRGRACDRGGGQGLPGLAGALGLRPRQGPQEDRRPDARPRRPDRPGTRRRSRASRWPRPRPRSCTRPTRSSGSPRRASAPTAGSSRPTNVAKRYYAIKHPVGVVGDDHPLELPRRPAQPQDRPGAGGRLHGRQPARRADAADPDPDVRVPGRRRRARRASPTW